MVLLPFYVDPLVIGMAVLITVAGVPVYVIGVVCGDWCDNGEHNNQPCDDDDAAMITTTTKKTTTTLRTTVTTTTSTAVTTTTAAVAMSMTARRR